jgi:hypothetical protein
MFKRMNKLKEKDILFFGSTNFSYHSNSAVYIDIDTDAAIKRVMKDNENNIVRLDINNLNKLDHLCDRMINNQNKIISILKLSAIPVLNINGRESLPKKIMNLFNFIKEI